MNPLKVKSISEQIAGFIDLTDANLEEISTPEAGRVQGGWGSCGSCGWGSCGSCSCSFFHVSARAFSSAGGFGSCSCGSCDFGSCSCGSCGFSCGSCEGWWD